MIGRDALQSFYYWNFSKWVHALGGVQGLPRLDRLARFLGGLRLRFGYFGSTPQLYLQEIHRCFTQLSENQQKDLLRLFWNEHQRRFLDLFLLPDLTPHNLDQVVIFENRAELDRLYQQGRGVILPVPHFGNVRLHHVVLALAGYQVSVVSGDYHMEPRFVQKMKLEHESKLHQVGFLSQGTAWMVQALKEGHLLQIASTAQASNQGVWVTLLGRPLYLPTGWLRLARLTGAPVLPTVNYRQPDGRYVLKILGEFPLRLTRDREKDLTENTQRLMDLFTPHFQAHPEQVDWMYWLVRVREAEENGNKKPGNHTA